jgi:uncharacterized protein (UPF0332 family)
MRVDLKKLVSSEKYCKRVFDFFVKNGVVKRGGNYESHLRKSVSNLDFGNFILNENDFVKRKAGGSFYDWAVIVYYYAIYHSVLALVSRVGYESKNHLATLSSAILFYYHKNKVLSEKEIDFIVESFGLRVEDINFLVSLKGMRERASYGVGEVFGQRLAESLRGDVVDFVNKVREELER